MLNGVEESWMWGVALIGFAAGIGAGFLLSLLLGGNKSRTRQLEADLEKVRTDHEAYRAQVHDHFTHTSDLFQDVTKRYRNLYDHLAHGAQDLCGNITQTPLPDLPKQGLLDKTAPQADPASAENGESPDTSARSSGL